MRKLILTAAMAVCFLALSAQGAISNSAHDFGKYGWSKSGSGGKQICLPCHTAHNALINDAEGKQLQGPLWNHRFRWPRTPCTTSGATCRATRLVLWTRTASCAFPATTARWRWTASAAALARQQFTGPANFGTDLSNDHPIGEAAIWPTSEPELHGGSGPAQDRAASCRCGTMADGRLCRWLHELPRAAQPQEHRTTCCGSNNSGRPRPSMAARLAAACCA